MAKVRPVDSRVDGFRHVHPVQLLRSQSGPDEVYIGGDYCRFWHAVIHSEDVHVSLTLQKKKRRRLFIYIYFQHVWRGSHNCGGGSRHPEALQPREVLRVHPTAKSSRPTGPGLPVQDLQRVSGVSLAALLILSAVQVSLSTQRPDHWPQRNKRGCWRIVIILIAYFSYMT